MEGKYWNHMQWYTAQDLGLFWSLECISPPWNSCELGEHSGHCHANGATKHTTLLQNWSICSAVTSSFWNWSRVFWAKWATLSILWDLLSKISTRTWSPNSTSECSDWHLLHIHTSLSPFNQASLILMQIKVILYPWVLSFSHNHTIKNTRRCTEKLGLIWYSATLKGKVSWYIASTSTNFN